MSYRDQALRRAEACDESARHADEYASALEREASTQTSDDAVWSLTKALVNRERAACSRRCAEIYREAAK